MLNLKTIIVPNAFIPLNYRLDIFSQCFWGMKDDPGKLINFQYSRYYPQSAVEGEDTKFWYGSVISERTVECVSTVHSHIPGMILLRTGLHGTCWKIRKQDDDRDENSDYFQEKIPFSLL